MLEMLEFYRSQKHISFLSHRSVQSLHSVRCFIFSFLVIFTLSFSSPSPVHADEARSFAITEWNGDCSGSTRWWWDDMCMAWRNRMKDKGWDVWWSNFGNVRVSKFTDPAIANWGIDNQWNGLDKGHASLICTHGGYDADGWWGSMHTKEQNECGANLNQMKMGPASGGNLRFYHMSSCNSIRWEHKKKWFGPAAGKVHVVTGFHGLMYIGSKYVDEYRELAKQGFSSKGVGKVWVDEMHHVDHWYNAWKTVCPIALGFGDTEAASANALNEKYNSKWGHKNSHWVTWRYKRNCDPDDGPKLP